LRSRQQTGIFEGFWTIAERILRPNERPKIPNCRYGYIAKNTAEARLAIKSRSQQLQALNCAAGYVQETTLRLAYFIYFTIEAFFAARQRKIFRCSRYNPRFRILNLVCL
jgi:hypothetical protein